MFPIPAQPQLVAQGRQPGNVPINHALPDFEVFGFVSGLDEGIEGGTKSAAVVDDPAPNFPGFPGTVVGTVVFEAQIKSHRNPQYTDRLPGQGKVNSCKMTQGSDGQCVQKGNEKWASGPVEGHPEIVISFGVHATIVFRVRVSSKVKIRD